MIKDHSSRRILLKASGEALLGDQDFGVDSKVIERLTKDVAIAVEMGVKVAIVIGGGNFIRGANFAMAGDARVTGDHMGMLGTVMNGLMLKEGFRSRNVESIVVSGLAMPAVCETFSQRDARAHFDSGRVVIFVGGMGNPYFTTDTVAVLRAAEMGCDAVFKGTQVDGVYTDDPKTNPDAKRFDELTHSEALERNLRVMDMAAIALARENGIPIIVFSIHEPDAFTEVVRGAGRSTRVGD